MTQDLIATRAYELWMERGCQHGNHEQDWLDAEAELLKKEELHEHKWEDDGGQPVIFDEDAPV